MKIYLSALFVTFIGLSGIFAQNLVVSNSTSSPNSCDGWAYISDSSSVLNTSIYWWTSDTIIQQGGYSITDICPGDYVVTYTNNGMSITETFTIGSGTGDPCSDFVVTVVTMQESIEGACDATAQALVSGGTAPYAYNWSNSSTANPQTGLCAGAITCSVVDANGCVYSYTVMIGNGNSNPCSDFVVTVVTMQESIEGACDATAQALVSGGTAPYAYNWSNSSTANPQTSLCVGAITCSVVDANGCVYSYTAMIGNGNNPGDTTVVIDNTNGNPADSSLGDFFLEDCEVILADIDSAYINGYDYNSGDSSIIIVWVVVNENGEILGQYTTVYGTPDSLNGTYSVSMTIYCQERAGGINTVTINDVIEVTGTAGISESSSNDLLIVNPFNDQLQILHKESNLRKVELFDMHGKLLLEENEFSGAETTLNTASIGNGIYLIKMTTNTGITQKRVVKQ